jgi:hypothetical protein
MSFTRHHLVYIASYSMDGYPRPLIAGYNIWKVGPSSITRRIAERRAIRYYNKAYGQDWIALQTEVVEGLRSEPQWFTDMVRGEGQD